VRAVLWGDAVEENDPPTLEEVLGPERYAWLLKHRKKVIRKAGERYRERRARFLEEWRKNRIQWD
jgi:hypothetical protein